MREPPSDGSDHDQGLADLLRRLGNDASALVRGEITLAKLEMRDAMRLVLRDSGKLAGALTLALLGGLALTAALVIGIGHLLDGRFGAAAAIVGGVFLITGAILARSGMRAFSEGALTPAATINSLGQSRDWARSELRQLRSELAGDEGDDGDESARDAGEGRRARTIPGATTERTLKS